MAISTEVGTLHVRADNEKKLTRLIRPATENNIWKTSALFTKIKAFYYLSGPITDRERCIVAR